MAVKQTLEEMDSVAEIAMSELSALNKYLSNANSG